MASTASALMMASACLPAKFARKGNFRIARNLRNLQTDQIVGSPIHSYAEMPVSATGKLRQQAARGRRELGAVNFD
jgi:hypothetical protein